MSTAFETWWDDPPCDGPTPDGPVSKATAAWIWRNAVATERERLGKKARRQRTELRRLNKMLGPFWAGVRYGTSFEHATALRVKMIAAFGHPAVFAAEHAQPTPPKDKPC